MERSKIKEPAQTVSELQKLRDRRIGKDATCKTCRYAYPIETGVPTPIPLFDCRAVPPNTNAFPRLDGQGNVHGVIMSNHYVPRPVGPEHFCGMWAPAQND